MHAFTSILASVVATSATVSASNAPKMQQQQQRILTNAETGTIIHPLIPHKSHLERRRRELNRKYGTENTSYDTTLPPRPHTSRHSTTPRNDAIISHLRANGKGDRNLQQQMGALYQGYGTHYVDLWVGSPTPQRQTVIVDTGSGVTAFPCEECKGCGDDYHTDNYYKESQSTTFRPLECNECFRGYCASMGGGKKKCRISMSYAEGSSWSAYEAKDLCYAGGPHDVALNVDGGAMSNTENIMLDHIDPVEASQFAFELAFGCQVSITGLFITQLADGIMGMENEKTAFWKQMHTANAIPRPEFSLCFSRSNEAEREGTGAGAMTLGGVDPRLHMSPMVFAKNVKGSGFYAVHLKSVYLREGGGVSAQTTAGDMGRMHKLSIDENTLNRGNVIVDSGTTDTYFTSALAGPFKKVWKELTGKDYNHSPVSLTDEEISKMPTIVLVMQGFDGQPVGDEPNGNPNDIAGYVGDVKELSSQPKDVVIAIPASHYMEFDPDNGKYVARFYTEESSGSVLGANAMMGHDVFFDVARGRVGFAESNCDYYSLLQSMGTTISNPPEKTTHEFGNDKSDNNNVSTNNENDNDKPEVTEEEIEDIVEAVAEIEEAAEEAVEEYKEEKEEEMPENMGDAGVAAQNEESEMMEKAAKEKEEMIKAEEENEKQELEKMEAELAGKMEAKEQEQEELEYEEEQEMASTESQKSAAVETSPSMEKPGPDQSESSETPYELFGNDKSSSQDNKSDSSGGFSDMAAVILDDMKHECRSTECRGIAGLFILGALVIVIVGIRRTLARRRVVRQYQEAELEISDLALDSDSDDEGGYVDEPPMPPIS